MRSEPRRPVHRGSHRRHLARRQHRLLPALAFLILTVPARSEAQLTATWNGGVGSWSDPGAWSVGAVPNNAGSLTFDVLIDGQQSVESDVTLDLDATIDGLDIDPTGGDAKHIFSKSLNVSGGHVLTLSPGGVINDSGTILLNDGTIRDA